MKKRQFFEVQDVVANSSNFIRFSESEALSLGYRTISQEPAGIEDLAKLLVDGVDQTRCTEALSERPLM